MLAHPRTRTYPGQVLRMIPCAAVRARTASRSGTRTVAPVWPRTSVAPVVRWRACGRRTRSAPAGRRQEIADRQRPWQQLQNSGVNLSVWVSKDQPAFQSATKRDQTW